MAKKLLLHEELTRIRRSVRPDSHEMPEVQEYAKSCQCNQCEGAANGPGGVWSLPLSVRAFGGLLTAGLLTIPEIEIASDETLLRVIGLGKVTLKEIRETVRLLKAQPLAVTIEQDEWTGAA